MRTSASLLGGLGCLLASLLPACGAFRPAPVTGTATLTSGVDRTALGAGASSATGDPCRGAWFDMDHADPRCLHHGVGSHAPPPSALQVDLAKPASVRSGYDAGLVVEMKNVTDEPLLLDVDDACGTFEAQASNAGTNSFESDCFGMCGRGPEPHVLRVTLEPRGVIQKKVKFYAVQTRIVMDSHEECVEKTMGGLPAGPYDLRITLPWTDAVPEDPAVTRPRVLEAKLNVLP